MHTKVEFRVAHLLGCTPLRIHSPADFRVSGLEVGDPLTSYLGSGLEVTIALILYAHTKVESRVAHLFTMHSPADCRVSGLEVGDTCINCEKRSIISGDSCLACTSMRRNSSLGSSCAARKSKRGSRRY